MKSRLNEIAILNGPMMIHVANNVICINAYQNEVSIPYLPGKSVTSINDVLVHTKGDLTLTLTSDIFDVMNFKFQAKNFTDKCIKDIYVELLYASIQQIAKITLEENMAALIQSTYNEKKGLFFVTIGLIDDARIIFCDIRKEYEKNV